MPLFWRETKVVSRRFYVYSVSVDGTARYVGKGCGKRSKQHLIVARAINARRLDGEVIRTTHFYNRLAKALRDGKSIEVKHIKTRLTEQRALELERKYIKKIPGLWNTFEGGEGWSSAFIKELWKDPSKAVPWKKNIGLAKTAHWKDPDKRKNMLDGQRESFTRPEVIKRKSEGTKKQWTPERKKKQSEKMKQRWAAGIYTEAMAKPEYVKNMSEALKRRWASAEYRAKMSKAMKAHYRKSSTLMLGD